MIFPTVTGIIKLFAAVTLGDAIGSVTVVIKILIPGFTFVGIFEYLLVIVYSFSPPPPFWAAFTVLQIAWSGHPFQT